jgi:hypothetical protein
LTGSAFCDEQKRDILGFKLEMPASSIDTVLGQTSQCQKQGSNGAQRTILCPQGKIVVDIATEFQPPLIMQVSIWFCDSHPGEAVARNVAQQFGLKTLPWTQQFMGSSASARLSVIESLSLETQQYSDCRNGIGYVLQIRNEPIMQINQLSLDRAKQSGPMPKF